MSRAQLIAAALLLAVDTFLMTTVRLDPDQDVLAIGLVVGPGLLCGIAIDHWWAVWLATLLLPASLFAPTDDLSRSGAVLLPAVITVPIQAASLGVGVSSRKLARAVA